MFRLSICVVVVVSFVYLFIYFVSAKVGRSTLVCCCNCVQSFSFDAVSVQLCAVLYSPCISVQVRRCIFILHAGNVQGEPKKYPNTKITICQKCANIFGTKFCSFVQKTVTVQKCATLCCIYLTCAKLTETQTSRTNFATVLTAVQKADFITKVIECAIPTLL